MTKTEQKELSVWVWLIKQELKILAVLIPVLLKVTGLWP